jgi:uncharacterized protein
MTDDTNIADIVTVLRDHVRSEERSYGQSDRGTDSLWDHLERVSRLAERLGRAEGVDPVACRLAGLFHDAGKFAGGRYHDDERPEEERSVECLRRIGSSCGLDTNLVDEVSEAILQLYRDDPEPTTLAQVLFDADNLDKLGLLGVANYFVKTGLRGRGVSPRALQRMTVELTYARHAPHSLLTETGRREARRRAPETIGFIKDLLDSLRADGLYDLHVEEVVFDGLTLDVVVARACACGGKLVRSLWEVPGIKCSEIHLKHTCEACGEFFELKFCRPRLNP